MLNVLYFTATWCGPCKSFGPVVQSVIEENPDVSIQKIDVDINQDLTLQHSIRSVPSLIFIKDGTVVNRTTGALSKSDFSGIIARYK